MMEKNGSYVNNPNSNRNSNGMNSGSISGNSVSSGGSSSDGDRIQTVLADTQFFRMLGVSSDDLGQ